MANQRALAAGLSGAGSLIELFLKDRLESKRQAQAQKQTLGRELLGQLAQQDAAKQTQRVGLAGGWDKLSPELQQTLGPQYGLPASSLNTRASGISDEFNKASNLSDLMPDKTVMQKAMAGGLGAQDDEFLRMMDQYSQKQQALTEQDPRTLVESEDPSTGAKIGNYFTNKEKGEAGAFTQALGPQQSQDINWKAAHGNGGALNPDVMREQNAALQEKTFNEHQGANKSDYGEPAMTGKRELASINSGASAAKSSQEAADGMIKLMPQLARLKQLSDKVNVYGPEEFQRYFMGMAGRTGLNPDAEELGNLSTSLAIQMANTVGGNKGPVTKADADAMKQRLMHEIMSNQAAGRSWDSLQKWIFDSFDAINSLPRTMPPDLRIQMARQIFGLAPSAPQADDTYDIMKSIGGAAAPVPQY